MGDSGNSIGQRALRVAIFWLATWVACAAVWLLLVDDPALPELLTGATVAVLAATSSSYTSSSRRRRTSGRRRSTRWSCDERLARRRVRAARAAGALPRGLRAGPRDRRADRARARRHHHHRGPDAVGRGTAPRGV